MALVSEKKGGLYTEKDKIRRQSEVFRLHFEYGYPAINIAGRLKINRNTINKDIQFWYGELSKGWKNSDFDSWLQKELNRFELQRCRIIKQIESSFMEKQVLQYERLLFDIDSKISYIVMRTKSQFDKKLSMAPKSQSVDRIKEIKKYDSKYLEEMR